MQLKELQTFELVAKYGNMTKAAQQLSKTVMAISKQVSNLEQSVGQPLFIRTRRELKLTEFGQQFLSHAQEVMQQHRALQKWVESKDDEIVGDIKVISQSGEMITETLVPWMAEFLEKYPGLDVSFDVKESLVDIKQDEYDVYWGIGPYLGERYPGLKQRSLLKERYGIFASPEYLKKKGVPGHPDDLEEHDVIGYLYNQPNNVLVLQGQSGEMMYKTPKARVKTVAGLLEFAQLGLGLVNATANARYVRNAVADGSLVPVMEPYWWDRAEAFVYFHQTTIEQAKVKVFVDFFLEKRAFWK